MKEDLLKKLQKKLLLNAKKSFLECFFCHITISFMEKLVGKLVSKFLLYLAFPPAPVLLFINNVIMAWLGGKVIRYLYNRYLSQYVERVFDWVKNKVKSAWKWFTSLFN